MIALVFAGVAVWLYLRLEEVIEEKLPEIIRNLPRLFKKRPTKAQTPEWAEIQFLRHFMEASTAIQDSEAELEEQIQRDFPDDPLAILLLVVLKRLGQMQSTIEELQRKLEKQGSVEETASQFKDRLDTILCKIEKGETI
jgi:hypothetical protein